MLGRPTLEHVIAGRATATLEDETSGPGADDGDRRRRSRREASHAISSGRRRGPGAAGRAHPRRRRRSCRWSTRPSWSPPPASWPATPWCTAAAATVVGRARHAPACGAGVRAAFADEGPGIADVDLALTDGWTSGTGLGLGLSGARAARRRVRAAAPTPGEGTVVRDRQVDAMTAPGRPGPSSPCARTSPGCASRTRAAPAACVRRRAVELAERVGLDEERGRRGRHRRDRAGHQPGEVRPATALCVLRAAAPRRTRRRRDRRGRPRAGHARRARRCSRTASPRRGRSASAWAPYDRLASAYDVALRCPAAAPCSTATFWPGEAGRRRAGGRAHPRRSRARTSAATPTPCDGPGAGCC